MQSAKVIAGLRASQWLSMLFILLMPFLLNAIAMWQEYGQDVFDGTLNVAGFSYDPWPDLLKWSLWATIPLGLLAWLTTFVLAKACVEGRVVGTKLALGIILALVTGSVTGIGTRLVDVQWSSTLRDGVGPGYAVSSFGRGNAILAASLAAVILLGVFVWQMIITTRTRTRHRVTSSEGPVKPQ